MTTMTGPDSRAGFPAVNCRGRAARSDPARGNPARGNPARGNPARGHPARGFTLVEVLVALAVVALALPALLFSLNQQVDGTAYLRDKSLAGLVASNKLEELRIVSRAQQSLLKGTDTGVVEMANQQWYWWLDSQPTEVESFYRVEITVSREETQQDSSLAKVVAYMLADLQAEPGQGGGSGN